MNETTIIDDDNAIAKIIEKYIDKNYRNNIFKILSILYGNNFEKDYIIKNYRNLIGLSGKINFKNNIDRIRITSTKNRKTLNNIEMSISPLSFYDYCMFPDRLLLRYLK